MFKFKIYPPEDVRKYTFLIVPLMKFLSESKISEIPNGLLLHVEITVNLKMGRYFSDEYILSTFNIKNK